VEIENGREDIGIFQRQWHRERIRTEFHSQRHSLSPLTRTIILERTTVGRYVAVRGGGEPDVLIHSPSPVEGIEIRRQQGLADV